MKHPDVGRDPRRTGDAVMGEEPVALVVPTPGASINRQRLRSVS